MEFSNLLEKLGQPDETNPDSEFSVSRALSLPLDFLVAFVRNRRESELLLRVSKSAASLDLLTQNYEMIASRAQILQEAWNGLWLAQEPYIVPAIPLIGFEMSGVNGGRSLLLGKMHNEINTLQELGNQLCHYMDVNYSLVEELRMEGIERLATNKLLLVEVERELARRITHVCNNKSVRDLSSMKQFLCQLRKPTFTADESRDHGDSTTNGSCSTQKVTTEGSSEAHQRSLETVSKDIDIVSPDSQSFASKCVATQGENMHPPPSIRHNVGLISTKMLAYGQFPSDPVTSPSKGIPSGTSALASAMDIKLDVRNHSSSASEERLPKVLPAGNGHNGLPQVAGNISKKQEHLNETGAEKQFDESSSRKLLADTGKQSDAHFNRVLLSEFGKVSSSAEKAANSEVELTQEAAQVDFRRHIDYEHLTSNLPNYTAADISAGRGLCKPLEKGQMIKICSHDFQSAQPDFNCFNRKRQVDCASPIGGNLEEPMDLITRKSKRIMVQASFETTKATTHASKDSIVTKLMHLKQGSSSNGFDDKAEGERMDMVTDTKLESCFIPCSCDQQKIDSINTFSAMDSKLSTQGRCKECGCFWSHSLTQEANRIALEQAPSEAGHVTESPVLATQ